jgi:putative sigma-54 modulation protein
MNLDITGKQLDLTDALKDFITERFENVRKHSNKITHAHVTCELTKDEQIAEARLHIPGTEIFAKASSDNMYKSIDLLIDKIIKQIDKYREKHEGK